MNLNKENRKKPWTWMVYLAGDNNLEKFGFKDLQEMKNVGSSSDVNIIAQFDSMSDRITRRYYLSSKKLLEQDCVGNLPETNTGDPKNLLQFINWSVHNYPAGHYALVLWNHGSGWKDDNIYKVIKGANISSVIGRGQERALSSRKSSRALFRSTVQSMVSLATERAILFDDTSADFLDNIELKKVLDEASTILGKPLDILGFDACLMNMIEVIYQVKEYAEIIVGSQETEPGDGWPYTAILKKLVDFPEMGSEQLGKTTVEEYGNYYQQQYPLLPVTQSAVKATAINTVMKDLEYFSLLLSKGMARKSVSMLIFDALRRVQYFSDRDYIDLCHFCQLIAEEAPATRIGKVAQKLAKGLVDKSFVVANKYHGDSLKHVNGLSIYFPTRLVSPLYSNLDFTKYSHWDELISTFVT